MGMPLSHPVTLDPPAVGAGPRRRPPRQDGLDTRHPRRWAPAGVCSACPGRGWRVARPSQSRSAPAGGVVTATTHQPRHPRYGQARAARPRRPGRAGRLPDAISIPGSDGLRQARPLLLSTSVAEERLACRRPHSSRAAVRCPRRRSERPVSGRLEGVQKV